MELQASHTFTVRYDDEVVNDAVRSFVWRRMVIEQKVLWGAAAVTLVAGLAMLVQGNGSFATLALVAACLPVGFSALVWRAHHNNTFGRYRRMGDRQAQVTVDAEGFGIVSDLGSGRLTWRNVTEIWERPRAFILFSGTAAFNTLPRQTMPDEVQAYLSARAVKV